MLSKRGFELLKAKGWKPILKSQVIFMTPDYKTILQRKLKYIYTFENHEGFEYQTTKKEAL